MCGGTAKFPLDVLPLPAEGSEQAVADVVVAGAGPVGLLLSCLLKQAGVDVVVVDPHIYPGENSKASITMSRSMELLEWAGAASGLREVGRPVTKARISVDGGKAWNTEVSGFQPRAERSRQQMIAVGQDRIESALLGRFLSLGGRLYRAARVAGYEDAGKGVSVQVERSVYVADESLRTPTTPPHLLEVAKTSLSARFLVGCDGTSSAVRQAMPDVAYPGKDYQQGFLLADADIPEMQVQMLGWHNHTIHVISDAASGALLYLVRVQGRRWRTWYSDPRVGPEDASTDFLRQKWQALMPEPALLAPPMFSCMTMSAMACKLAGAYRRGHVFLAGDAAHSIPAVDGQGMNLGLQDAGNLAWKLAEVIAGRASDRLLDTYEAERRPVAMEVLANTDKLFSAMGPGSSAPAGAIKQAAIKTVLTFMSGDQVYDRDMVERANGLGLSYLNGTCLEVGRAAPAGALRAGSRLPDVECREDGSQQAVHTLQLLSEGGPGSSLRVLLLARASRRQISQGEVTSALGSLRALVCSSLRLKVALYTCAPSASPSPEGDEDAPPQRCCFGLFRKSAAGKPPAVEGKATQDPFEALDGCRALTPLDPGECTRSPCAELCTRFGLSDNERAILVVRPDGYVAVSYLGQAWDAKPIGAALEELGIGI